MKIIAMNLPQYHVIPENNEWWGEGFTDWVNVKKARPLYKGHEQPVVPLHQNYYDLANIDAVKAQIDLANRYGVYGFCYYHYWFNGKKLLEKPCEILLEHPEIDAHYCMCWANESWARTWDGKDSQILIEQTFGGQSDWKEHIQYLLPFFKDKRYIKKGNKPVMFFYSISRIEKFEQMIAYWETRLREEGFDGLYIVEFVNSFNSGLKQSKSDVICEFEPHATCRYDLSIFMKGKRFLCKKLGLTDYLNYDSVWKSLIHKKRSYNGKKVLRSGFVNFDNSPRKGKKALVMRGGSPEKFYHYMSELVKYRERDFDDSFLVINAWNEWAEGAMLEPTEKEGFQYLEAVKKIADMLDGIQEK